MPDKDVPVSVHHSGMEEIWAELRTSEGQTAPFAIVLSLGSPADADLPEASLLCPEEASRHRRIREPVSSWAYLCSHVALRLLAGRALRRSPAALEFLRPGAPNLAPRLRGQAQTGLQVSLSHSGGWAAIGLRRGGPVGIDVEQVSREIDALAVADHFLTPDELNELRALPGHAQGPSALRSWCAKEAVLKAAGTGLSTDPRTVPVHWSGHAGTSALDGVGYELGRIGERSAGKATGAIAGRTPVGQIIEAHSSFNELLSLFRESQPWWETPVD